jgi:hypothetical protein
MIIIGILMNFEAQSNAPPGGREPDGRLVAEHHEQLHCTLARCFGNLATRSHRHPAGDCVIQSTRDHRNWAPSGAPSTRFNHQQ